jgi:hypothetical protein
MDSLAGNVYIHTFNNRVNVRLYFSSASIMVVKRTINLWSINGISNMILSFYRMLKNAAVIFCCHRYCFFYSMLIFSDTVSHKFPNWSVYRTCHLPMSQRHPLTSFPSGVACCEANGAMSRTSASPCIASLDWAGRLLHPYFLSLLLL